MITAPVTIDRAGVLDRFARMRARTRSLFALVDEAAYYERPIPLRNPIVFYEGHLPAFAVNTLVKKGLGRPGIDEWLEEIFARGIDPATQAAASARGNPAWPSRDTVQQYAAAADSLLIDVITSADLERDDRPLLRRAQALWAILEHEDMHQETLAYMWHQLPYASKRRPPHYVTAPPRLARGGPAPARARIPAGSVTMGTDLREAPFAWDNELPPHCAAVDAFTIDVHDVTNREYLEFVEAEGVAPPPFWEREHGQWYQRGMFERVVLPDAWPVYVTWAEANEYARWRGARLPTEAEFHRAAFGTPGGAERRQPWGDSVTGRVPANVDFRRWDPEPVGSHADGASAFGVHDLVGNGWEWTSTPFGPFNGFEPLPSYPEYSMEFFDGDHYVLKGASPVTPRTLLRRGFRNWFRPRYPYVYATFRCVEM
jgi:formylglycine-generating enzyme required for sulfatase activity